MAKQNKIFNFIDHMTKYKTPVEKVDFTGYSRFIIDKLISSTEIFLPAVAKINTRDLSNKQHYSYYKSILPKRKIYSTGFKLDTLYLNKIKAISRYYELGLIDSEIYYNRLSDEQINKIIKITEG